MPSSSLTETVCLSETSVFVYNTTWYHSPHTHSLTLSLEIRDSTILRNVGIHIQGYMVSTH
jgi:hypothetical protein